MPAPLQGPSLCCLPVSEPGVGTPGSWAPDASTRDFHQMVLFFHFFFHFCSWVSLAKLPFVICPLLPQGSYWDTGSRQEIQYQWESFQGRKEVAAIDMAYKFNIAHQCRFLGHKTATIAWLAAQSQWQWVFQVLQLSCSNLAQLGVHLNPKIPYLIQEQHFSVNLCLYGDSITREQTVSREREVVSGHQVLQTLGDIAVCLQK